MIRVGADTEGFCFLWCETCLDWEPELDSLNIRALNDIALRHEASVEHLLRVMGSDR